MPKLRIRQVLEDANLLAQLLSCALTALDIIAHEPMVDEYHRTRFAQEIWNTLKTRADKLVIPPPKQIVLRPVAK
jgi:hypothetical protein